MKTKEKIIAKAHQIWFNKTGIEISFSIDRAIRLILSHQKKEIVEEVKEMKLEFSTIPKDFFKGVSATYVQLYLSMRDRIIREAVESFDKLKQSLTK